LQQAALLGCMHALQTVMHRAITHMLVVMLYAAPILCIRTCKSHDRHASVDLEAVCSQLNSFTPTDLTSIAVDVYYICNANRLCAKWLRKQAHGSCKCLGWPLLYSGGEGCSRTHDICPGYQCMLHRLLHVQQGLAAISAVAVSTARKLIGWGVGAHAGDTSSSHSQPGFAVLRSTDGMHITDTP